jgi:hypothetical protein
MPKIVNFQINSFACPWGILSSKMESWSISTTLLISILYIIIVIVNYYGERENKIAESILRKLV